jgi:hypothetical protein
MDNLEKKILSIICDWNPIGVDNHIAQSEYASYVPQIRKSMKDRETLMHFLQNMVNIMGLNFDSTPKQITEDLMLICSKLLRLKDEFAE